MTNNTIYYAKMSGLVKAQAATGQIVTITGYADTNITPTTIVDQQ